jgi:hypothetical protein
VVHAEIRLIYTISGIDSEWPGVVTYPEHETNPEPRRDVVNLDRKPINTIADLPAKPEDYFTVHLHGQIDPDPEYLEDRLRIAVLDHYEQPPEGVTLHPGMRIGETLPDLLTELVGRKHRLVATGPWDLSISTGSGRPPENLPMPEPHKRIDFHLEKP